MALSVFIVMGCVEVTNSHENLQILRRHCHYRTSLSVFPTATKNFPIWQRNFSIRSAYNIKASPRIKLKTRKMKAIFVKSFTLFFHYLSMTNIKHIKDKMSNSYICLLLSCENCWNTSLNAVLRSRLCPFVPSGCFSHHLLKLQTRLLSQPSC